MKIEFEIPKHAIKDVLNAMRKSGIDNVLTDKQVKDRFKKDPIFKRQVQDFFVGEVEELFNNGLSDQVWDGIANLGDDYVDVFVDEQAKKFDK